jgi:hypothetical protein
MLRSLETQKLAGSFGYWLFVIRYWDLIIAQN